MQDLGINCPSLCSLMCPVYLRFGDSISLPLLPCLSCLGDSSSLYLTPLSICLPETWLQFGDSLSAFPCLFSLTYLRGYLYVCPCVAYPRDYPVPVLPTRETTLSLCCLPDRLLVSLSCLPGRATPFPVFHTCMLQDEVSISHDRLPTI